jgi:hypothetical protein
MSGNLWSELVEHIQTHRTGQEAYSNTDFADANDRI